MSAYDAKGNYTQRHYGEHVDMTCENHPTLRWSCKNIAVGFSGRYNESRNIFFYGEVQPDGTTQYVPECTCPGSCLISVEALEWKSLGETEFAAYVESERKAWYESNGYAYPPQD